MKPWWLGFEENATNPPRMGTTENIVFVSHIYVWPWQCTTIPYKNMENIQVIMRYLRPTPYHIILHLRTPNLTNPHSAPWPTPTHSTTVCETHQPWCDKKNCRNVGAHTRILYIKCHMFGFLSLTSLLIEYIFDTKLIPLAYWGGGMLLALCWCRCYCKTSLTSVW